MRFSEAVKALADAGIENARGEAMEIFSDLGGFERTALLLSDVDSDSEAVIRAVKERTERKPLQYILGRAYFYKEEYEVNESCLIPRQDTEILVDFACRNLPEGAHFVDLCTGSGCIAISTLKNTEATQAVMVDISADAMEIAKRNAEKNGVYERCSFVVTDAMRECVEGDFFAVLSNPPYVKDSVYEGLDREIFHEPKIAFVGGEDGADFYRKFTKLYRDKIADDGFIAYEIGFDQAEILNSIAKQNAMSCEIIKDFSGNDRVAVLKKA